ncbi:MAG: hypothetical protein Q9166_006773 [cf. Caloplaca sp. 2 TL-2023]
MPSTTNEIRDREDSAKRTPTTPSPSSNPSNPSIKHKESIQNAFTIDQSKSATTSPQHQRIKSVISTSSPTQVQTTPTSSPSALPENNYFLPPAQGSYLSSQPGTSGIEARSLANKRAPASHSSHGIPTANGPPPALITQRSYHAEPWRNPTPTEQPNLPLPSHQQSQINEADSKLIRPNITNSRTGGEARSDAMNYNAADRNGASTVPSHRQRHNVVDNDDTLRTSDGTKKSNRHLVNGSNGPSQEENHSYSSHEDLFLNLARADSEASNASDSTKKIGRRGSEIGLSTSQSVRASRHSGTRPASSGQNFGGGHLDDNISRWSRSSQFDTPMNSRHSSPRDQKYAASAHPLDQKNHRYLHSELSSKPSFATPRVRDYSTRETSPELPASSGRRQSIAESRSGTRPPMYKPSPRSHISGNYYDSSPTAQGIRSYQSVHADDTVSTISTTAPSTVWDELDDLKSRIRKLELTGKMPSSSGAAMAGASGDRPRTATTTMTTTSSSPKESRPRNASPEASTVKGTDTASLHPLLHSALANAKPLIDSKAYKALESTASDALILAAITGATKAASPKTTSQDTSRTIDRQLRRKADCMCRSLTELCIALSEEKSSTEPPTAQTGSKDDTIRPATQEDPARLHAKSQDFDRPSSRIISRLEARRTSLLASNLASPSNDSPSPNPPPHNNNDLVDPNPNVNQQETPINPNPTSSRNIDRVLLHRRRTADSNADTVTLHSRPVSREQRPSPQTRISHTYTSQHPLPTLSNTQRSPSIQSSLASNSVKKSYFPYYSPISASNNNNNSSPSGQYINSPIIQPGNRRYISTSRERARERERQTSTPSSLVDAQQRAAERQHRIASLGQYSSGRRLRLVEGEQ